MGAFGLFRPARAAGPPPAAEAGGSGPSRPGPAAVPVIDGGREEQARRYPEYAILRDAMALLAASPAATPAARRLASQAEGADEQAQASALTAALGLLGPALGQFTYQERQLLELARIAARHYRRARSRPHPDQGGTGRVPAE
ncbi:hypothetical protein [Sinomonas terrae]|uniref:Uncharacterized protein n=1 Tax=Sinomonas terrae TaxID=2908838 RepID=A0ABS9U5W1_9MICC|nr:hypothetical protein [Sinomonas terrae]MCH6472087.1 hypothetical protein [Sinomonas terrae]